MARLVSAVPQSPAFAAHNRALAERLRDRTAAAARGGPETARDRHVRRGKLPARERIERLLDPGAPFLEIAPLAAYGLYDNEAPSAGILAGIGRVAEREVLIIANDPTVKGGAYFPMT